MVVRNLTPHCVNVVITGNESVSFPAEDVPARVSTFRTDAGRVDDLPLWFVDYGKIENLPDPTEDTFFIVSAIVLDAASKSGRGTADLLVPEDMVRDGSGRVVGCRGFRTL